MKNNDVLTMDEIDAMIQEAIYEYEYDDYSYDDFKEYCAANR